MNSPGDDFEANERECDRRLLRRMADQVAEIQGSVHMLDRKVVKLESRVVPRFGGLLTQIEHVVQRGVVHTVMFLCFGAALYKLTMEYQWIGWVLPPASFGYAIFIAIRDHKRHAREIERQEAAAAAPE